MKNISVYLFALLGVFACNQTDEPMPEPETDCDQFAMVNEVQFRDGANDFHTLIRAEIAENCLEIEFSASGCDGNSWEVALLDSGAIAESFPVQRSIRLSLNNPEACQAIFTQTHSFDLSPIQVEGNDTVILNLEGWRDALTYTY